MSDNEYIDDEESSEGSSYSSQDDLDSNLGEIGLQEIFNLIGRGADLRIRQMSDGNAFILFDDEMFNSDNDDIDDHDEAIGVAPFLEKQKADTEKLEMHHHAFGVTSPAFSSTSNSECIPWRLTEQQIRGKLSQRALWSICHRISLPESPLLTLQNNSLPFCSMFSNTGKNLITADREGRIRFYETESWKKTKEIEASDFGYSILDLSFSPDEKYVAYSSWSDSISLVNINTSADIRSNLFLEPDFEFGYFCVFSLDFSADSTQILCGSNDHNIYVYNLNQNQRTDKVKAHSDDINAVCWFESDNSNIALSGSDDSLIKFWDRRVLNQSVGVFAGHTGGITCLDSKKDGRYFISQGKDEMIKLWDIRKLGGEEEGMRASEWGVRTTFDYRYARRTYRRMYPHDQSIMSYFGHMVSRTLIRARFSPLHSTGQKYIASGSSDGIIRIYDVLTGNVVRTLIASHDVVRDISWHNSLPVLVSASWDGKIIVWG